MRKSDIYAGIIIGVAIALLLPVIARTIEVSIPFERALIVIFPVLTLIGLYVAQVLSRVVPVLYQVAKFALVGALNTAVDFGVANFLILLSGTAVGLEVSAFKGISFTVAVINSYFWNKFWTFRKKEGGGVREFSQFLVVSAIGFGINVGAASLVINVFDPVGGLSPERWANIGFLVATFVALTWNFVGYKFIVFKKN